jgi:hypothetical protein
MLNEPTALIKKVPEPDYPWDRQTDESPQAFAAFAAYRDMGLARSTREVARSLGKHHSQIGEWSRRHEWVARVTAWDARNDAELRRTRENARRKALDNQLRVGELMLKQAEESMLAKAESDNPTLEAKDVPNYAKTGQALAAAALGLDAGKLSLEAEEQSRRFQTAILSAIDEADEATGDRVRANIYKLGQAFDSD